MMYYRRIKVCFLCFSRSETYDESCAKELLHTAAKQAAFEEQLKLKNQFRALDNDEIDFLDEVRAKEKADEARAKKELETGLKAFRERQKSTGGEASATANEDEALREGEDEEWAVGGRKRKRHEREMLGVKKKVVSKGAEKEEEAVVVRKGDDDDGKKEQKEEKGEEKKTAGGLGLVGYGSDSDESGDED